MVLLYNRILFYIGEENIWILIYGFIIFYIGEENIWTLIYGKVIELEVDDFSIILLNILYWRR